MSVCTETVMYVPGGCADDMLFWALRGFPCRRLPSGLIELTIERRCEWLEEDGRCRHEEDRPRLCRGERDDEARRAVGNEARTLRASSHEGVC